MFSSLVTATKNRYASLRAGDEADGDTEDDSHISRVLRNYYTEQGRPFPPWLGGGPQAQAQQQAGRPGQQPGQGVSLRRGQTPGAPQQGVKNTLSDIWDTPAGQQKAGGVGPPGGAGQAQKPAEGMNKMRFFRRDQGSNGSQQMQYGHQSQGSSGYDDAPPPPNQAAQSSIRDRLWSNRGGGNQAAAGRTPSPQLSSPTPPPPPQQQQYQAYNGGSAASKGYGARDKSPARGNGYGGNGGRGDDKPVMSATISFGQDDYGYGGYGGYSGTGSSGGGSSGGYRKGPPLGGGKVGLPSGPRMHR